MLLRAVFRKKLSESSFDIIDILIGFDSADTQMRVSEVCDFYDRVRHV